ncbi:MAG TPA: cytochrome c [Sphingomicrobium sp.]|nr:cytochrome c [Sphingomicrobium sp.]
MANGKPFDLKKHLPSTGFAVILLLVLAAFGGIFIFAGVYNIGADAPHSSAVFGLLQEFREKAVAHHARNIAVPRDLNATKRIAAGAGLYNEMCTGCHLGPGIERSELSQGLYPSAPELARGDDLTPAEQFWVIKHGVKLTAMPSWGKTHDDELIWDMVAFIQQLPKMSAEQYKSAVASAPEDHQEIMEHMRAADHPAPSQPHSHSIPTTEVHHH